MLSCAARGARLLAGGAVAVLALTGCASGSSTGGSAADDGRLPVTVGFYPLQYVAEQVGGNHVEVSNLTKPGAEAHDLEIAPRDIDTLAKSSLVLYLKGFQPAVDEAVAQNAADSSLDVTDAAKLEPLGTEAGHHADDGHDHSDDLGGADPHFWLDPERLGMVADEVATRLAEVDPDNAADYQANARRLHDELSALDQEYSAGLAQCSSRDVVTSHAAFGYLTRKYDLNLIGISGVDPSQEPSPATMAEVAREVQDKGITTIYTETVASPALAKTIAAETGAKTATLDPLESLAADTGDYQSVMQTNLATLRTGQGCS